MDTKRFSPEDLGVGMQAQNAQTGHESESKEENNQLKTQSPQKTQSSTGKRVAVAAGAAVGGAALGAAAMVSGDYLKPENVESQDTGAEVSTSNSSEPKLDPSQKVEDASVTEPVAEGQHEIFLDDNDNPTVWTTEDNGDETILVNLNPNEDDMADVEIKSLGKGQGNEMLVDVNGDLKPDVRVYAGEDGNIHVDVTDSEQVNVLGDDSIEGEESTDEPIALVSDNPEEIFDEEDVIPNEVDENGDLLVNEFDDSSIESDVLEDNILDDNEVGLDGADDMDVDLGVEDIDMV